MFSIFRFIVIVGLIFYYSPVRQRPGGPDPLQSYFAPGKADAPLGAATAREGASGHLESVWQTLPNGAKQAVVDKILSTSGLAPAGPKPSDTLQPEDRAPEGHKSRN